MDTILHNKLPCFKNSVIELCSIAEFLTLTRDNLSTLTFIYKISGCKPLESHSTQRENTLRSKTLYRNIE